MNHIIKYSDLNEDYSNYNAWKSDSSFPIMLADKACKKKLFEYEITEYIFDGIKSQRSETNFNLLLEKFDNGIKSEIFASDKAYKYLFAVEHKSGIYSKLRSYKGLVDKKKLDKTDYFQFEAQLPKNQTIISFVANLNSKNFDYLIKFFFDESTSFIIKSNNDYLNEKFITKILGNTEFKGNTQINYLKLVLNLCSQSDIIYRVGGNEGEDYWSLQKLQKKKKNNSGG